MKTTKILLALCILALAVLLFIVSRKGSFSEQDKESIVLENIATRTSIRAYTEAPVEQDKIEKLLKAAMAAPTAMNKQPWHFVVVTDKDQLKALSETSPYSGMIAKAPLAIVVCGDMLKAIDGGGRDFWIQDASAATENLLLAANAMGLGAVWTGVYPDLDRCKSIAEVTSLPENIIPLNVVVIGYPAQNPEPKDKWKPANVSYNRYGSTDGKTIDMEKMTENTVFSDFDYTDDFTGNPFLWFKGDGLLLAVGNKEKSNAMTIGWGALGNLWGHDVNTLTVYVSESRFSQQMMEDCKYFTVMTFDESRKDILEYMGSHSGRDEDKAKAIGLHTRYTEHGAPYYQEAYEVYECELIYKAPFIKENMTGPGKEFYAKRPQTKIHHMYIGRILSAKRR
ncbi:MAG: nitroreductase family protein [Bacteroidales bacterium]|nr:nitroreductase family protein [Bacteroidales bacterium]